MSEAARLIPARVFRQWWERLIQLDQQEAEQGNAADVGEAGDLLTRLDEIGHANGAVHWGLESTGYGAGSTASFNSTLHPDFDWENDGINFLAEHPYGGFDPEPLIAAIVRVTGIPESGE